MGIFFSYGFRPFFLGASLYAAINVGLLANFMTGAPIGLGAELDIFHWHAREMLFGYVGAVLGGFALTAVANWTGRPPVSGFLLGALFFLWLAGRAAMGLMLAGHLTLVQASLIDLFYLPALVLIFGREVIAGGNRRNLVVVAGIAILAIANLCFTLYVLELLDDDIWEHLGVGIMALLIALIGGRITPAFTGNWLRMKGMDADLPPMGWPDKLALLLTGVGMAAWVALGEHIASAILLMAAGAALVFRVSRWQGVKTLAEPLLGWLHGAYGFLGLSVFALGLSLTDLGLMPEDSAIHLLTAGAIGLMTMTVMARAALGHTGRPLRGGPALALALMLVAVGALTRASAPLFDGSYMLVISIGGLAWAGGIGLFAMTLAPILLSPRVDQ